MKILIYKNPYLYIKDKNLNEIEINSNFCFFCNENWNRFLNYNNQKIEENKKYPYYIFAENENKEIIGVLKMAHELKTQNRPKIIEISYIDVHLKYRKQKIGFELLKEFFLIVENLMKNENYVLKFPTDITPSNYLSSLSEFRFRKTFEIFEKYQNRYFELKDYYIEGLPSSIEKAQSNLNDFLIKKNKISENYKKLKMLPINNDKKLNNNLNIGDKLGFKFLYNNKKENNLFYTIENIDDEYLILKYNRNHKKLKVKIEELYDFLKIKQIDEIYPLEYILNIEFKKNKKIKK